MGLLIYAGFIFLVSLAALRKQSRLLLFFLQFQSFLFVFFFFWITRDNYQILQVKKIGYQLEKVTNNFREPARAVSIGGDQSKDDIYSPDLPPGAAKLVPSVSASQVQVSIASEGILATQNRLPLNSVLL